jgi:hypothetical protein
MADCSNQNIHLFVKCLNKSLSSEQKEELEIHVSRCEDCFLNFVYVEEILNNKQKLSYREKDLLVRYMIDPILQMELDRMKEQVLSELRESREQFLREESLNSLNSFHKNQTCIAGQEVTFNEPVSLEEKETSSESFINKYSWVLIILLLVYFLINIIYFFA